MALRPTNQRNWEEMEDKGEATLYCVSYTG